MSIRVSSSKLEGRHIFLIRKRDGVLKIFIHLNKLLDEIHVIPFFIT